MKAAQLARKSGYGAAELVSVGDVGALLDDPTAKTPNHLGCRCQRGIVHIDGSDRRALLCCEQCRGATYAAAGAGDEHGPTIETRKHASTVVTTMRRIVLALN